jgi:hypothetical protein
MPQTRSTCPRCRQPHLAEVNQLFDVAQNPEAKQILLSGQANVAQCPNCGTAYPVSVPIVYHDPEKELLLTYFPPELGLPVNEQERLIGPMITQITNKLPMEKRKAYLLRPQTMFTMQTLVEKVLEGDGITKEMLQASQQRMQLLQRLVSTPPESRVEVMKQEEALIDEAFFNMLNRLLEVTMAQRDETSARMLYALQQELFENTAYGRELKEQVGEAQEAARLLQEASKQGGLTRQKLLDLIIESPNTTRVAAMVSMTRTGLDYNFFQLFTEKIDQSEEPEKTRLTELRNSILEMTQEMDKALQEQVDQVRQVFEEVVAAPNTEEALQKNSAFINEIFMDLLETGLTAARKNSDLDRLAKLNKVKQALQSMAQQYNQAVQEATRQALEEILNAPNLEEAMQQNSDLINQNFLELVEGELKNARQSGNLERSSKLQNIKNMLQPPEMGLLSELLEAPDEAAQIKALEANRELVTPKFMQLLNSVLGEMNEENSEPEVRSRLELAYRTTLRFSMKQNLEK